MEDRESLIKSLEAEIAKYEEFLARASEASELAAAVQKRKEEAEARLIGLRRVPEDVLDEVAPNLQKQHERDLENIDRNLPKLPVINVRYVTAALSSTGTSSDSDVVASFIRVDPAQVSWYPSFIEPYKQLADDRSREDRIANAYSALDPGAGEFAEKALATTKSAMGGVASVDLACQHMRDAIQQIWGQLCHEARADCEAIGGKRLELRKVAHRLEVAACLGASTGTQPQIEELLSMLHQLHGDLSGPAKDPFGDDLQFLEDVATRWKLHLYNLAQSLGI